MSRPHNFKDRTGERYGRLVVVEYAGFKTQPSGQRKTLWKCVCDCGNEHTVMADTLNSGNGKSCGCLAKELLSQRKKTHGMRDTPTYKTWCSMRERCYNPKHKAWKTHGAKGITVCDRWNPKAGGSFENFYEDMGERPDGTSIDRIDVHGNYTPENCRWADAYTQAYNKGISKANVTGKTGVSYYSTQDLYAAEIRKDGVKEHLGFFKNLQDAIDARIEAELRLFGYVKE